MQFVLLLLQLFIIFGALLCFLLLQLVLVLLHVLRVLVHVLFLLLEFVLRGSGYVRLHLGWKPLLLHLQMVQMHVTEK